VQQIPGYYAIRNRYATDHGVTTCLDAKDDAGSDDPTRNGDKVQLWTWNETANQVWFS
jgi:hypothetical protein